MNLYKLTQKEEAAATVKELYKVHLESIIEMLADEAETYNTFTNVDIMLQSQKEQFIEMTLDPLLADIKAALMEQLKNVTVTTNSITTNKDGLTGVNYCVNVIPIFPDVPF